jgi:hypothetical protein
MKNTQELYTGTPVGIFSSEIISSEILSKYFTKDRNELPYYLLFFCHKLYMVIYYVVVLFLTCAAIITRLPDLIDGAISLSQNGRTRSNVV